MPDAVEAARHESQQALVGDLVDRHTQEVWLQQEAAYYRDMAVGVRVARENPDAGAVDENDEAEETNVEEG